VVPTFYDSIEIARDRAIAKFHRRAPRWTAFGAFVLTLVEALLTLTFVRLIYRALHRLGSRLLRGKKASAVDFEAAAMAGAVIGGVAKAADKA
jgi:hypothetical protein